MIPRVALALALLLGLTAATALAQGNVPSTQFGSPEQQGKMIGSICLTQLNLDEAGCACFGQRAVAELSPEQRDYLILSVVQPPAAERLPIARVQTELAAIATFIQAAGPECGAAAGTPAPAPAAPPAGDGSTPAQ